MAAASCQRAELDRVTFVEAIRGVFARSPIFCGATLSEPRLGPREDVTVEVSFDHGPPALRVTAASDEKVYAILHELASTMVEIERAVRLRGLGEMGPGQRSPEPVRRERDRWRRRRAGFAQGARIDRPRPGKRAHHAQEIRRTPCVARRDIP